MNDPRATDIQEAVESFRAFLRTRDLPVTGQRAQVAEVLFAAGGHLSVDDVEQALRRRSLHIGKATIYRTLDLLVQSGMVVERDFGEGFHRYERVPGHPHHEHLICMRCGKVIEFSNEGLERAKARIADEYGFTHHHHRLEIYGVCRECQQRDTLTRTST